MGLQVKGILAGETGLHPFPQLTRTEVPEGARDAVALTASLHGNQLCNSRWSPPEGHQGAHETPSMHDQDLT